MYNHHHKKRRLDHKIIIDAVLKHELDRYSMSSVANDLSVDMASLYRYYHNKDEVTRECVQLLLYGMDLDFDPSDSWQTMLRTFSTEFNKVCKQRPDLATVFVKNPLMNQYLKPTLVRIGKRMMKAGFTQEKATCIIHMLIDTIVTTNHQMRWFTCKDDKNESGIEAVMREYSRYDLIHPRILMENEMFFEQKIAFIFEYANKTLFS
ncbi:hypothetical protein [Corynebacterium sp. HS2168-gen11]|uniref:hypothetical protein n=1 Tax=Corynebacterium sp. HS2168-gen11 TaxID=2974027 RepID=UPI00216AE97D|nr:hypothetical protein [Corynebacterium sp. HS2168-gen11]MCS4536502.1 hypothetical protein [Corynebacterium sp. HS2168-gen11]